MFPEKLKRIFYGLIGCMILWSGLAILFVHGQKNVETSFFEKPEQEPTSQEIVPKKPPLIRVTEVAKYDPEIKDIFKGATRWFGRADPVSQNYIGWLYETGSRGVSKNDINAAIWYRRAAQNGNTDAQNNLGLFYENGRGGLFQDNKRALILYRAAADAGNDIAKQNLARLNASGTLIANQ